MHQVGVSRGFLGVCDVCYALLKEEKLINTSGRGESDDGVVNELCANCQDFNKPLIDDLMGSAE